MSTGVLNVNLCQLVVQWLISHGDHPQTFLQSAVNMPYVCMVYYGY